MRGRGAIPPNFHPNFINLNENQNENNNIQENEEQNVLSQLGFEEGELEMFSEERPNVNETELINKYLEIAREQPFSMSWNTLDDALNADYMLNVFNSNGSEFTKHDIVKDVLNYYYNGGKRRKNKKTRKNRKSKSKRRNKRTKRYIKRYTK